MNIPIEKYSDGIPKNSILGKLTFQCPSFLVSNKNLSNPINNPNTTYIAIDHNITGKVLYVLSDCLFAYTSISLLKNM